MQKREVEVKFFLDDIDQMQRRIAGLGAESQGRVFENNIRYDDDGRNLSKKQSLLRLRQDKSAILTFKSKPATVSRDFKIYNELEVEVSDFKTMDQILACLGWQPVQRYEKWRETLFLGPTAFFLDTLPYGTFLEIEGQENDIQHYAAQLNLNWQHRIILNYLEIFDILIEKQGLSVEDLTFENFQNGDCDAAVIVDQLIVSDEQD